MSPRGDRVVVRAPAKINLALRVGPLREDGYHELVSVFQAVSLFEEVSARLPEDDEGVSVVVRGPGAAEVPTDASNLAVRAALLLAERTGAAPRARLAVRKTVPVGGGMAGGSADAAAALLACDLLWGTGLHREELAELGAELGSDVPFALVGGTALGTGRGERLSPVLGRGEYHWVLALSPDGLSTPQVYAELDRLRAAGEAPVPELEPDVPQELGQALRSGDPARVGAALVNDLQEAACSLRPGLRRALALGEDHGALGGLVSGSGPTVAFLVPDSDAALELAVALTASGVASDVRRVTGPVPGARSVEPVATSPHHPSHSSR
ncbi:4-(cytidine 5'-diphospho)-2-C-methyl-D-erythritol kinase [Quadrisphaera sp. DSM 44207]|uniref:4-(cytidine 5'-diphospho)-2-C-methyl-D-erythritol kinase n=1 Tax=Quadrisphaera sp. DSM 44207 TaxID=1881057 RepID=UPI00088253D5|nr:4-(cytidine 5'-diphospho)-2-C-methyl-D-erythritol kinase [Quadrisphaera sp. DSM 44207]SDQ67523.1 4-diphosphocytidyl-2-C-methyl-D-erythritol kinase [Quadrisphaera sp. DSM 44207]